MKWKKVLRIIATIVMVHMFFIGMIIVAFLLTELAYSWLHIRPSPFVAQIATASLGTVLAFVTLFGISQFIFWRYGNKRLGMFSPVIEAMERIAKGDFAVRLDPESGDDGVLQVLVNSVNTMASELDQMETMRQEFISNVSHEIQSPLTSIRGFARALQSEQLEPEQRQHYLGIIEAESMRLSRLSDNLLSLASLDSEQVVVNATQFRLDRQIRDVILASEPQWQAKQLELDVALDPITCRADHDLLSQIWTNLIHNSIKFTPDGGRICVSLCQQEAHIQVTVSDSGIGIAEEDLPHLFERFFKADRSRERAKGGSGLGLSIAQKIVQLHHGAIDVKSELGTGTCFTVCLPNE